MNRCSSLWMIAWASCAISGPGIPSSVALAAATGGAMTGKVITVSGPIDPTALGTTLVHEHIFIDARVRDDTPQGWAAAGLEKPATPAALEIYRAPLTMNLLGAVALGTPNKDNGLLSDEKVAAHEALQFKRHGGGAIVDVTSVGLRRDPQALLRIAQATGLHIVMGSSWFRAQWAGEGFGERSPQSLTDEIVRDITVGVEGTGIRAGIIGEILASDPTDIDQRKILQASARASRITGAAISIHGGRGTQLQVLDVLVAAGADPSRVAIGRSTSIAKDFALLTRILDRGAYVQFDSLGDWPHVGTEVDDHDVAVAIVDLIKLGFAERVLLSHDVHEKTDLKSYGGAGYSFISEYFVPYLRNLGVTQAQIDTILIENPRRLLTLAAPRN